MSFRGTPGPRESEAQGFRPMLQLVQDRARLLLVQPRPSDDEGQEVPVMLAQEIGRRGRGRLPADRRKDLLEPVVHITLGGLPIPFGPQSVVSG